MAMDVEISTDAPRFRSNHASNWDKRFILDDAALQSDDYRVSAIVRAQLRKDALYMVFNGIFGDVELVCDYLVRISFGHAP